MIINGIYKRHDIFKYIFIFISFTALTKTYVFWAVLIRSDVAVATAAFFFLTLIFILHSKKALGLSFFETYNKSRSIQRSLLLLYVIGPLILFCFHFSMDIRSYIISLFQYIIFVSTILGLMLYDNKLVYKIIFASLLFNVVSGFYSMIPNEFFKPYAEISDSWAYLGGRAIGFYMQPNSLALGLTACYIALLSFYKSQDWTLSALPIYCASIVSTGSRASFVFLLIPIFFLLTSLSNTVIRRYFKLSLVFIFAAIFVLSSAEIFGVSITNFDINLDETISERIAFWNDVVSGSENTLNDESLLKRKHFREIYWKNIVDKLIIGSGFGIQEDLRSVGLIEGSAHNSFLELLLQGGLFFLIIIFMIFKNLILLTFRSLATPLFPAMASLVGFIIYFGLFNSMLFVERCVPFLIAVITFQASAFCTVNIRNENL